MLSLRALLSAVLLAAVATVPAVLLAAPGAQAQPAELPLEQVQPEAENVLPVHIRYEEVKRQQRRMLSERRASAVDTTGGSAATGGLDIDGLVLDETRTRIGRSFYDAFYQRWRAPEGASGFTVTVREQPLRGQGVLAIVRVNDEVAFQARLQPRSDFATLARQAVAYAHRRLRETGPQTIL